MVEVIDFLDHSKKKGYEMVTLNLMGEKLVVLDIPSAIEEIKKIDIKCILDTYFEEINFESNNGELYELVLM